MNQRLLLSLLALSLFFVGGCDAGVDDDDSTTDDDDSGTDDDDSTTDDHDSSDDAGAGCDSTVSGTEGGPGYGLLLLGLLGLIWRRRCY